ncbi:MAG: threonine-phosphate decarboxylase CobD [Cyanobacteria bacterium P01_A01_bin.135]
MTPPRHGGNLAWAAELAGCFPQDILDFSASINPLGPPEAAIAAIQSSLDALRAYPDPDYRHLRQSLADFHQLSPACICPGNGAAELLTWVARELAQCEAVHLPVPAFGDYWRSLSAFAARVIPQPLSVGNPVASPLAVDIPSAAGSGILINNPHNPTGALFDQVNLLDCLDAFDLVVVDEAFIDFLPPDQQPTLLPLVMEYPNLVVLRSLTKFYSLPGLRIGYAVTHPDRLQRWRRWRDPWPVNVLAAAAAEAALQDTAFHHRTWQWLPPARQQLRTGLKALPGLTPYQSVANYILVHSETSSLTLQYQLLQQHRLLIRDCASFAELGDRYFRVAVRTPDANQRLLNGIAQCLDSALVDRVAKPL